jgi:hypothetical protein
LLLQLGGEGMLMRAGRRRGTPKQVRQEQQHDRPGGEAALTENAQHGPHSESNISWAAGGRHDGTWPTAHLASGET